MKYGVILLGVLIFLGIGVMLGVVVNALSSEQCEPVGKGNSRAMSQQLLLPYFLTPALIRGEAP